MRAEVRGLTPLNVRNFFPTAGRYVRRSVSVVRPRSFANETSGALFPVPRGEATPLARDIRLRHDHFWVHGSASPLVQAWRSTCRIKDAALPVGILWPLEIVLLEPLVDTRT